MDLHPEELAAYQRRDAVIRRNLVWITAKNRDTGEPESIGLWNGFDTAGIAVISGETNLEVTRTYQAFGTLLGVDPIPLRADLAVRTVRVRLSPLSAAVQTAFRLYDARHAPIEIHRLLLHPETRLPIAAPRPRLVGWINRAPTEIPVAGGESGLEVAVVSHTRMLTRTNPAKKSDETQRRRAGDRVRRYSGVSHLWDFWWGEQKGNVAQIARAPALDELIKNAPGPVER